ncbi:MAG: hypothetical protein KatS3mg057_1009 [Herpetosiphonaceae bacterium]|nr:MAG: hypothetical protein KatS3mg057_1009 [Herpetosiphonaceae bacterium]
MLLSMFALIIGMLYLTLGILGLIPVAHTKWPSDAPPLVIQNASGYLLGFFPSNLILAILHLLTGLWAIAASYHSARLRIFAVSIAVVYGIATMLGIIPLFNEINRFIPLFGRNSWLHGLTAAIATFILWRSSREDTYEGERNQWYQNKKLTNGLSSRLTIAGYPLHPILTPFPIASFSGILVTDLGYWWTTLPWYNGSKPFWGDASAWLAGAGVLSGIVAALVGLIDFATIREIRGLRAARLHAIGAAIVLILGSGNLILRVTSGSRWILPWGIALSALTAIVLAPAVWYGGRLVYCHMAGVASQLPEHKTEDATVESDMDNLRQRERGGDRWQ